MTYKEIKIKVEDLCSLHRYSRKGCNTKTTEMGTRIGMKYQSNSYKLQIVFHLNQNGLLRYCLLETQYKDESLWEGDSFKFLNKLSIKHVFDYIATVLDER